MNFHSRKFIFYYFGQTRVVFTLWLIQPHYSDETVLGFLLNGPYT